MVYFISFLEGIITFISPCLLPMLPVYISYFSAAAPGRAASVKNAAGFVAGFTVVFVMLGAFAGTLGRFLIKYNTAVNLVSGIIVIIFGLNFMGIIRIPFVNSSKRISMDVSNMNLFQSVLFGIIFSIGWTPCVGAFLGSALMQAAQSSSSLKGIIMLLCYSMGLGIPFIASALLIDRLKSSFDFIKRHYSTVNLVSGGLLVLLGILMATGLFGYFASILSF